MNQSRDKQCVFWICIVLAIASIIAFEQVRQFEFVSYDDGDYVTKNPYVRVGLTNKSITWAFTAAHASNWHPMTWLSHMLDCNLFGLKSGLHHLTNLLLHIANTLLLFVILKRMTGAVWPSAFVAAAFALHPLHVESVAWISQRKDVLSSVFWFLTMIAYLHYVRRPGLGRYLLTLLAFALGLMTKPMLVTVPFVLLLLDYWPLGRFHQTGKRPISYPAVWEKIPFFLLSAASSAVTLVAQQRGGSIGSAAVYPFGERVANALLSYTKYIGKMVWPFELTVFYPFPSVMPGWQVAGAFLLLAAISFGVIKGARQRPYAVVGWLWYLGTLVPVIGLVQVGSQAMADRYTYLPLIGLFMIAAWGISEFSARRRIKKVWLTASAGVLLSLLITTTWRQVGYWENSVALFSRALAVTTDNPVAHNNLGYTLSTQGKFEKAITHYLEALRLYPDSAVAHYNLGNALGNLDKPSQAIYHYLEVLRLNPKHTGAHNNLGNVLAKQGKLNDAVKHYSAALKIDPENPKTYKNFGAVLVRLGRLGEAIPLFRESLQNYPGYPDAHSDLGIALAIQGRMAEAIAHFRKALRLEPGHVNAAHALELALAARQ
ncbi:MAG: tetratricopeptide repeat protein [Planctomycetes bacterium]|nr:tetratricopeptide repeat protein [Planctomycetota bacterium]